MASSKVGQGFAILDGRQGKSEFVDKDSASIGACYSVQAIEKNFKILSVFIEELLDEWKIEDPLEESNVISDRVNDGHFGRPICKFSDFGNIKLQDMSKSRLKMVSTPDCRLKRGKGGIPEEAL